MSMSPKAIPTIPEDTIKTARKVFRKGNPYLVMRDDLGTFFKDDQFQDLYPADGQPAFSPWRLALVCVMQFAENLSDHQAANAVRARIDWKYALSLALDDEGFDHSVLCEFRQRLLASADCERLLTTMLQEFKERKLLKARGKQRTDATHVLSANRLLNRLEMVGETLHHALNQVATHAPDWLKDWVSPIWFDRYGRSFNEYRLPTKDSERDALAVTIGIDGLILLDVIYNNPSTPPFLRHLNAVETLRHTWVQQYWMNEDQVCWRAAKDLPPCGIRLQSPYETDARYATKRSVAWVGYKAHLTETCDEDSPHLITHVETTAATVQDVEVLRDIHKDLAELDDCQAKPACTKAKRRTISVQTKEIYDFLKLKRAFQKTQDFRDLYRQRAGVEGTISQAAWVLGMRQSRYRGLEKTHLQNVLTAAAINLTRAVNWITEIPLAETRTSRFATLAA